MYENKIWGSFHRNDVLGYWGVPIQKLILNNYLKIKPR
jgi:hypothetical protein